MNRRFYSKVRGYVCDKYIKTGFYLLKIGYIVIKIGSN
jgi:hypothetical protein